jgi:hypothetical protein
MLNEEQVKKIKEERHYRKAETLDSCALCRHLHSISPSIHRCSLIGTEMNKQFAINAKFVCERFERLKT